METTTFIQLSSLSVSVRHIRTLQQQQKGAITPPKMISTRDSMQSTCSMVELHNRGQFHRSWAHSANHRDSSIKVGRTAQSALDASKKLLKSWAQGAKQFLKATPGFNLLCFLGFGNNIKVYFRRNPFENKVILLFEANKLLQLKNFGSIKFKIRLEAI